MKIRRAHFKCNKRLNKMLKFLNLNDICNKDFKNFWKDIKHMNNARLQNTSNVGSASDAENVKNICELFSHIYLLSKSND